jgi:hypothetical protein
MPEMMMDSCMAREESRVYQARVAPRRQPPAPAPWGSEPRERREKKAAPPAIATLRWQTAGSLGLELLWTADEWLLPEVVQLHFADGRVETVRVDEGHSTRSGPFVAGGNVRLVLRGPAIVAAVLPARLELPGGMILVIQQP